MDVTHLIVAGVGGLAREAAEQRVVLVRGEQVLCVLPRMVRLAQPKVLLLLKRQEAEPDTYTYTCTCT